MSNMNSRLVRQISSLVHSFGMMLALALAGLIGSVPAHAQNAFQVDSQHSIARLSLGSGQNALEIGLARVSGQVVFDSLDPADPSVSLKIEPDNGLPSDYAEMNFTSERSAITADGKLVLTGTLSVTRVERSVSMEPNEGYAGPQYGLPVTYTDTHEVTLVFSDPGQQAPYNATRELSGITSVNREVFPEFVDAVTAGDWPKILVDDEKCQEPSTIGEDYSGATCTGSVIATAANRVVITGTAGGEDYSGFRSIATPDRMRATLALDLKLTEQPSTASAGPTATQTK